MDNLADEGSAAFADSTGDFALLENNLLVSFGPATVFGCGRRNVEMPAMIFNDVFSDRGNLFSPTCISPIGTDGNVSVDPRFARDGSFRLTRAPRSWMQEAPIRWRRWSGTSSESHGCGTGTGMARR